MDSSSKRRLQSGLASGALSLLATGWLFGQTAYAVEVGTPTVEAVRPIPAPIRERIAALVGDTLQTLLGDHGTLTLETLAKDPTGVSEQIRTGVNWELEDRGYQVTRLVLGTAEPLAAAATVDLVGAGVASVKIDLAPNSLPAFWASRMTARLDGIQPALRATYEPLLIGLPIAPKQPEWSRNLTVVKLEAPEVLAATFPEYDVASKLTLGDEAEVQLTLTPRPPVFSAMRVEARSESLLMATLDPVEELVLRQSDLVVGQPLSLVKAERHNIEAEYQHLVQGSETARTFHVFAPEVLLTFQQKPDTEARAVIEMESSSYDLRAEAFVDLGNDRSPAEFQAHAGYRSGVFEGFVVLNVLTESLDVRPDVGLGFSNKGFFAGSAWDAGEGTLKYFASFNPSPWVRVSAEVFAERDKGQTQLGVLYQPTQQLGLGAFTDGEGQFWVRTSFRL